MPTFQIPNGKVIGAFNETSKLQKWLRPGFFAYIVGVHVDALKAPAVRLYNERSALIGEHGARHPDGHPHAGELVVELRDGVEINTMKSAADSAEFARREAELFAGHTTVTVDDRITPELLRKLDAERLPTPRDGADPAAVDFSAILALVTAPDIGATP